MRVSVKVVPKAKRDEIIRGDPLVVRVTDPPEKNKANKKALKLLAEHFGRKVLLVAGAHSRTKTVEILDE